MNDNIAGGLMKLRRMRPGEISAAIIGLTGGKPGCRLLVPFNHGDKEPGFGLVARMKNDGQTATFVVYPDNAMSLFVLAAMGRTGGMTPLEFASAVSQFDDMRLEVPGSNPPLGVVGAVVRAADRILIVPCPEDIDEVTKRLEAKLGSCPNYGPENGCAGCPDVLECPRLAEFDAEEVRRHRKKGGEP